MSEVTPGLIKGLFFHLVKAAGGIQAAGAVLNISHQRVSQLQNVASADLPTLMQVATLEAFVGQPIVTSALADVVTGGAQARDLMTEVFDVTEAAADLQRMARAGADRSEIRKAALEVERELQDVEAVLNRET
jgi:hypothetical protein